MDVDKVKTYKKKCCNNLGIIDKEWVEKCKNNTCLYCGKKGHYIRECLDKKNIKDKTGGNKVLMVKKVLIDLNNILEVYSLIDLTE